MNITIDILNVFVYYIVIVFENIRKLLQKRNRNLRLQIYNLREVIYNEESK